MSYDFKVCDWEIGPSKWTMRRLDLGKDFEKSELDMELCDRRAFQAEEAFNTQISRLKQGGQ